MHPRNALHLALLGGAVFAAAALFAGQQAQPVPAVNDNAGFEPIFDGQTLAGWEGDPQYWRVEGGALVGETTPANIPRQNSFIIWRGGTTVDFELKLEYRVTPQGNSGIQYRSAPIPDQPFALRGYQFDVDGERRNNGDVRHTGNLYEERGRTFLALRGQMTRLVAGLPPQIIGSVGDYKELAGGIKNGDWNEVHIIATGHTFTHLLNGRVLCVVVDEDAANRRADGLLGVQVHTGPAMKIEYRNIRLKKLPPTAAGASTPAPANTAPPPAAPAP